MAFDETTAGRVRRFLLERTDVVEKRIIGGGVGFMVNGHLCCGVLEKGLTVRVGPDAKPNALTEPHVRPLCIGGSETTAFVVVEPEACETDEALEDGSTVGSAVATLPAS